MTLHSTFKVGEWLVEPSLQRISRDDDVHRLEPRIVEVLVFLAERPGQVVSREEIIEQVWPQVVVNEDALTRAISDLRSALGDDPNNPAYIETVRGRGYRLIASVAANAERNRNFEARTAGVALVAAVLVALAGWALFEGYGNTPVSNLVSSVPFTSFPGFEIDPDQSPDGSRVVYAWTDDFWAEEFDLFVKQRDSEVPLQVTNMPGFEGSPAWSPDGSTIAFANFDHGRAAIHTVPAIGGPVRELVEANSWIFGLDWAPDGRSIVFAERGAEPGEDFHLVRLSLDSMAKTALTTPPTSAHRDHSPAIAPDGRQVAFVRNGPSGGGDLFVVSASGRNPERLTRLNARIGGLDWSTDGTAIYFTTSHPGLSRLWRVTLGSAELREIPTTSRHVSDLSIGNGAVVFEEMRDESGIYRMELLGHGEPQPIAPSTQWDGEPALSPDGSKLAFASSRAGSLDLWVSDADGGNPLRLTHLGDVPLSRPRWSPSGAELAYNASDEGIEKIYIVDARRGSDPRRLLDDDTNAIVSGWSSEGSWIYFASDRSGSWNIWKIKTDGGHPVQVTRGGGTSAKESPDGKFLVYTKPDRDGLFKMELGGGEETIIDEHVKRWARNLWDVSASGIFYLRFENGRPSVVRTSFDGDSSTTITSLPGQRAYSSVSVSPDGSALYFAQEHTAGSDLRIADFDQ